jgi:alkyldihydroxyacetonephosphate synthase
MSFEIDRASLLVGVPGAATLAAIERALASEGLTIGVPATDTTVADWLASGAPGAPPQLSDPVDHLVAGLTATLTNGRRLEIRPAPRRAVGPDLVALFFGAGERFGTIEHVWLRVHLARARRPSHPVKSVDLDPPVSSSEAALLDAIDRELHRVR